MFLKLFYSIAPFSHSTNGGSSRRAAGLQPSLKNVRQKIPPNGQTRLKFGFSYENFTTQSFPVLPTPFRLNVSLEYNKTNVSLFANGVAYAMTFSAHLPMNLAIVIGTALKERNQPFGCKNHGGVSTYRKAFLVS